MTANGAKAWVRRQRRAWVLTFCLAVALGSAGLPLAVVAQADSVAEPAASALRKMAGDDVRHGKGRQTREAIEIAQKRWPAVDAIAARSVYDEAYTSEEQKNQTLWKAIKPYKNWAGAVLVLGLFLGALLRDSVKKLGAWIITQAGEWIYARLGGSKAFRVIALRRYRAALRKDLGKLKLTFRPDRPLDMRDVFVPLRVEHATGAATLDALQAIAQHGRLVVKGPPGSGKSMLLRFVAFSYAEGRLRDFREQPIPIVLELHRLRGPEVKPSQIVTELAAAFARADFPDAQRFVEQALEHGSLLLLFDGLDEVATNDRSAVIAGLKNTLAQYRKCRAVVTCRSAVYHNELHEVVDQTLELAEFSNSQIRRFLRAWLSNPAEGKSVERLLQSLRDRPSIMALARNPLLLTLIAYLYSDTAFVLPHSRSQFYEQATDRLLGLRDQERGIPNRFTSDHKRRVLQHVALLFQEHANAQARGDRRSMDTEAVHTRVVELLPRLNLDAKDAAAILEEIVERSGLLLSIDRGQRYQFGHLTLQEFFAATALRDKEGELRSKLSADLDAWREPAKLWCGLASNSSSFLRHFASTDPTFALECLANAQEVEEDVATQVIGWAEKQLNLEAHSASLATALGSVAADERPRGRRALSFLEQRIGEGTGQRAAALAPVLHQPAARRPRFGESLCRHEPP